MAAATANVISVLIPDITSLFVLSLKPPAAANCSAISAADIAEALLLIAEKQQPQAAMSYERSLRAIVVSPCAQLWSRDNLPLAAGSLFAYSATSCAGTDA